MLQKLSIEGIGDEHNPSLQNTHEQQFQRTLILSGYTDTISKIPK